VTQLPDPYRMLHSQPRLADRAVARANADAVATLLGGTVKRRPGIRLGESDSPFELRRNFGEFWFGVAFSDQNFLVSANHKKPFQRPTAFVVSLFRPDNMLGARIPLQNLSAELGIPVFIADVASAQAARSTLLAADVRPVLIRINREQTRSVVLSDVQLRALTDFTTAAACAEQSLAFKEIIERVNAQHTGNRSGGRHL
jgi:hypothetical protein